MLHLLDDMDAKMNEMESVMRRTPVGAFSEKIWSLDRRLYHPRTQVSEPDPFDNDNRYTENKDAYAGLLNG